MSKTLKNLKETQKKLKNKKGFTLAELLVVVAIIAVLVAVSIPVFTGKLEKAREATDIANMRAAKSEAVAQYLDDDSVAGEYTYDAVNGKLVATTTGTGATGVAAYGKGTTADGKTVYSGYTTTEDETKNVINVSIAADGTVSETWVAAK